MRTLKEELGHIAATFEKTTQLYEIPHHYNIKKDTVKIAECINK
jgi:hypothetical protein